jgi:hypothetical protein
MPVIRETNPTLNDVEGGGGRNDVVAASNRTNNNRSRHSNLWLGMAGLAFVACVITVPVVLTRRNDNNTKVEASAEKPSPTTDSRSSHPDSNSSQPKSTTGSSIYSTSAASGSSDESLDVSYADSSRKNYSGIFNYSIELLSADVVSGYENDAELQQGISNAANFYLGSIYKQYTAYDSSYGDNDVTSRSGTRSSSDATSGYGTRNQELGIEEGDMIVSDGNYCK